MFKKIMVLGLGLAFIFLATLSVHANAAEPPVIIIVIEGIDLDLKAKLISEDIRIDGHVREHKIETTVSFFNSQLTPGQDLKDKVIFEIETKDKTYTIEQEIAGRQYNQTYTLDKKSGTLLSGKTLKRNLSLIGLRFGLTLLIEGIIFFLMGYRQKRTWIAFFVINIITQGWLNYDITFNWSPNAYVLLGFVFLEIIILTVESIFMLATAREGRKRKLLFTVVLANFISMFLGGYLLLEFPL